MKIIANFATYFWVGNLVFEMGFDCLHICVFSREDFLHRLYKQCGSDSNAFKFNVFNVDQAIDE